VPSVPLLSYSLKPPPRLIGASRATSSQRTPPRRTPAPCPDAALLPALHPSPKLLYHELVPHRETQACGVVGALPSIEKLKHVVLLVHFSPPRSSSIRACALPLLCIINSLPPPPPLVCGGTQERSRYLGLCCQLVPSRRKRSLCWRVVWEWNLGSPVAPWTISSKRATCSTKCGSVPSPSLRSSFQEKEHRCH
jgi:hypothetical protein